MAKVTEPVSGVQRPPYYVTKRAHPFAFKPYDWTAAKRDRHVCHNVSHRLSAGLRRLRKQLALGSQFVAPEGSTLAGAARTDDPPAVPMSGWQGPADAAKPSEGRDGDVPC